MLIKGVQETFNREREGRECVCIHKCEGEVEIRGSLIGKVT